MTRAQQATKQNKNVRGNASGPKTPSGSSPGAEPGSRAKAARTPHARSRPTAHSDTGAEAAATHEAALRLRNSRPVPNNARDNRVAHALRSKGMGGRGAKSEALLTAQLRDLASRVAGNHDAKREKQEEAAEEVARPVDARYFGPAVSDNGDHECGADCGCADRSAALRDEFTETTELMELRAKRAQLLTGAYQHILPRQYRRGERGMAWVLTWALERVCAALGIPARRAPASARPLPRPLPSVECVPTASIRARVAAHEEAGTFACLRTPAPLRRPLAVGRPARILITGCDYATAVALYTRHPFLVCFDPKPHAAELEADMALLTADYPNAIVRGRYRIAAVLDVAGLWDPAAKARAREAANVFHVPAYSVGPSRSLLASTSNPKPMRYALDGAIGPEILVSTAGAASSGAWAWAFADQSPRHAWLPIVRPEDDSHASPVLLDTAPGGVMEVAYLPNGPAAKYPRRSPQAAAAGVSSWLQGGFLFHTSVRNTVAGATTAAFGTFAGATAKEVALAAGHTTLNLATAMWQVAYLWGMLEWLTGSKVATLISIDRNPAAPSVWDALRDRFWWRRNAWWLVPLLGLVLVACVLDAATGSGILSLCYYVTRTTLRYVSMAKLASTAWSIFASPAAIMGALASLAAYVSRLDRAAAVRLSTRLALAVVLVLIVTNLPTAAAMEAQGPDHALRALAGPERAFGPPIWQVVTFLVFWLYVYEGVLRRQTTGFVLVLRATGSFMALSVVWTMLRQLWAATERPYESIRNLLRLLATNARRVVPDRYHIWAARTRDALDDAAAETARAWLWPVVVFAAHVVALYAVYDAQVDHPFALLVIDVLCTFVRACEALALLACAGWFVLRRDAVPFVRDVWPVIAFAILTGLVTGARATEATYQEDRWSSDNPLNYVIGAVAGVVAPLAGLRVGEFLQAPQAICPAGCVRELPPTRKVTITVTDRRGSSVIENDGEPCRKLKKLWKRLCAEPCKPEQAFTPLGPIGPGILTYRQCRHGEFLAALSRVFIPRTPVDPQSEWFRRARASTRRFAQLCIVTAMATERWWPVNEAPQYLTKGGRYWADFTRLANPWREGRPGFRGFTKAETSAKCIVAANPDLQIPKLRPRLISNPDPSSLPQIMTTMSSVMSICKDCVELWNERELRDTDYSVTWGVGKSAKGLSQWFETMLRTASRGVIIGGDDSCYVDCAAASPRAINGDGSNFDATVSAAWKLMIIEEVYEPILRHHPDRVMAAHVLAILWENARTANITIGGRKGETRINFRGEGCRNSGEVDTTFGNTFLLNLAYHEAFFRGALSEVTLTKVYEDFGFIPEVAEVPIERAEFFSCLIVPVEELRDGEWAPTYVWSPLVGRQIVKFMAKYGAVRACDVRKQRELRQFAMWLLAPATPVLRGMAFNHSDKFTDFDLSQLDAFRSGILHPHPWLIRPTEVTYTHFANRYGCSVEELRHLEAFVRTNHDRPWVYTCNLLEQIFRVDMGHDLVMPPFRDASEVALVN